MTVAREDFRAWLDTSGQVRSACDLDLLLFFKRHSHSLLTTEQLARFVGYGVSAVTEALEHLQAAGLVASFRDRAAEVDLYMLTGGDRGGSSALSLSSLLEFASTRDGRLAVIDTLKDARTARGSDE
jgi:hypothetical protein